MASPFDWTLSPRRRAPPRRLYRAAACILAACLLIVAAVWAVQATDREAAIGRQMFEVVR